MRRAAFAALLAAIGLGSGCATRQATSEERRIASKPIRCETAEECDIAWSAVVAWVSKNSRFRMQQQTDLLVSTYCQSGLDPCFEVTRQKLGGGASVIDAKVICTNPIYGCWPNQTVVKADLTRSVLGEVERFRSRNREAERPPEADEAYQQTPTPKDLFPRK